MLRDLPLPFRFGQVPSEGLCLRGGEEFLLPHRPAHMPRGIPPSDEEKPPPRGESFLLPSFVPRPWGEKRFPPPAFDARRGGDEARGGRAWPPFFFPLPPSRDAEKGKGEPRQGAVLPGSPHPPLRKEKKDPSLRSERLFPRLRGAMGGFLQTRGAPLLLGFGEDGRASGPDPFPLFRRRGFPAYPAFFPPCGSIFLREAPFDRFHRPP